MKRWWRHAFAVPDAQQFVPTPDEQQFLQIFCDELQRRRLIVPASVMIESLRPLAFIGSQLIWCIEPWMKMLLRSEALRLLAGVLERPGGIDYLLDLLTQVEDRRAVAEECDKESKRVE